MNNFKNVGRGLALASTSLALGSVVAMSSNISSAYAVSFFTQPSVVNFAGAARVTNAPSTANPSPTPIGISFLSGSITNLTTTGDFAPDLFNTTVAVSDVTLTNPVPPVGPAGTLFTYTGTPASTNPFITFANGLTFVLDDPTFAVTSQLTGSGVAQRITLEVATLAGTFFRTGSDNQAVGLGNLTINQILGNGSYSATLVATPLVGPTTPEPTATLGLAALGLGAFFTSNLAKKKKAAVNA
ncbi:hypothetical protein [Nostoc sp. TCL26-01]|uniref:hypothetical protein n=1 Tax=Nostoc sp. TCL26-01 TaxID=2576904 RepID=UPI0015BDB27D|nr:hypothetical protein [Nostoc sp. TCL26-01]QLE59156.1 hypothetical protein FD725_28855 [Nostoc sp. TCL26-01]